MLYIMVMVNIYEYLLHKAPKVIVLVNFTYKLALYFNGWKNSPRQFFVVEIFGKENVMQFM